MQYIAEHMGFNSNIVLTSVCYFSQEVMSETFSLYFVQLVYCWSVSCYVWAKKTKQTKIKFLLIYVAHPSVCINSQEYFGLVAC